MDRPSRAGHLALLLLSFTAGCGDDDDRASGGDVRIVDAGTPDLGGPVCEGEATPCSAVDLATCDSVPGCRAGSCSGRPFSCVTYEFQTECAAAYCDWDYDFDWCEGSPAPCDFYSADPVRCDRRGCDWIRGDACTGSTGRCSSLGRIDCASTPGCRLVGAPAPDLGPPPTDGGPADLGTPDLGGPRDWPSTMCPFGVCDLRSGEGCPDGQTCILRDESPTCESAGSLTEGESCSSFGDCAVGHLCIRVADETVCRRVCCGDDDGQCSSTTACQSVGGVAGAGACLPQCDAIAQDCATGQGCYRSGDDAVCLPAGEGGQGDSCSFRSDCDPGYECVAFSTGSTCAQLCRLSSPSCAVAGLSCRLFEGGGDYGFCG